MASTLKLLFEDLNFKSSFGDRLSLPKLFSFRQHFQMRGRHLNLGQGSACAGMTMACNLIHYDKRFVINDKHEMISVTMVVRKWPLIKWGG
jgi:hypothetical protein